MSRSRPFLLRVLAPPGAYAALVGEARAAGLRVGWLDLRSEGGAEIEAPADLLAATGAGVLRAVAVGREGSVAVKARTGPPALRDVLREHFAGCALVLVRGPVDAPLLETDGDGWRVRGVAGGRQLTTAELVSRLRRPRLT